MAADRKHLPVPLSINTAVTGAYFFGAGCNVRRREIER